MERGLGTTRSFISHRAPDDAQVFINRCHLPMGMRHIAPASMGAKPTAQ